MFFIDEALKAPSKKSRELARSTNRWLRDDYSYADQALANLGVLTDKAAESVTKSNNESDDKDEQDTSGSQTSGSDNQNETPTTDKQDVNTTVPAPPTTMTMEDYEQFAARFEGLKGLDLLY